MATIAEIIDTNYIVDKSGNQIDLKATCTGKTVGLYFSGHWCPPCEDFTKSLIDFYQKYSNKKQFQVIFISSDRNEIEFRRYSSSMPWLILKYSERTKKQELVQKFKIDGIPHLLLMNADTGE
ncbi:unnamed protein product, partial [Didymodactylos carnosus]